jgi:acetyl esterase/lipase
MKSAIFPVMWIALCSASVAAEPVVVKVWPGTPPGESGKIGAEKFLQQKPGEKKIIRVTNVTVPTLSIFRPDEGKGTGAAVIICPGGAYHILAWDLEGEEVAAWLNSIGVTGIVLKYRVPRRPGTPASAPPAQALMDAQRAVSLVRSKAAEWRLDPKRVGIMGFSAGGHLAAATATNFDKRTYPPIDAVDQVDCRPDFAVLVYPAYLVQKGKLDLNADIRVSKTTPPMFLAHAANDPVKSDNSVGMFLALQKAGVRAEMHVFASGGHGFGLRPSSHPCVNWPHRCADWLRDLGIIK